MQASTSLRSGQKLAGAGMKRSAIPFSAAACDRNYLVLTVRQGQIAAMGAYGDGAEASRSAGLGQPA